jgi:L,D-peptidoglycan transpeptidase YkuD (ErfK/YbiS/YcfS/YnhG family)
VTVKADRWTKLLTKYRNNKKVNQLIFVKYTGGSKARLYMYNKTDTGWKCILNCTAYVGQNGIGKQKEGDRKTPTGVYTLTQAFGIRSDPGAKMDYSNINKYLYWCADPQYYNQLVDVRKMPHDCSGEHLIDYVPQYNYGMVLNYNKNNVYKKGSAIFLHCTGSNRYTGGCIAVSQSNMIRILKNAEKGTRICIYKK